MTSVKPQAELEIVYDKRSYTNNYTTTYMIKLLIADGDEMRDDELSCACQIPVFIILCLVFILALLHNKKKPAKLHDTQI